MATANMLRNAANQVSARQAEETARSNQAREKETYRSNRASEREKAKSRKETERSNRAKEQENIRHNKADERIKTGSVISKTFNDTVGNAIKVFGLGNDPSWYNRLPDLIESVAKLPMNIPVGGPESFGETGRLPLFMRLGFVPSFGSLTADYTTPAQQAIRQIWSFVRHANSGSVNGDPADYVKYFLCYDSVLCLHARLTRLYGVLMYANRHNLATPKALVESLGFDYTNIIENIPGLRLLINTLATKINQFYVPNIFPLFYRHRWMLSTIWKDHDSETSQLYFYDIDGYYLYNENNYQLSLYSSTRTFNANWKTEGSDRLWEHLWLDFGDIQNQVNKMVDSLYSIEDISIISGDIRKAYGEDQLFSLPMISEDYICEPAYSAEVLSQIQNGTFYGTFDQTAFSFGTGDDYGVYETSDGLIHEGSFKNPSLGNVYASTIHDGYYLRSDVNPAMDVDYTQYGTFLNVNDVESVNYLLNMFDTKKTAPDDIMVATRMRAAKSNFEFDSQNTKRAYIEVKCAGSEIPTQITIFESYRTGSNTLVEDFSNFMCLDTAFAGSDSWQAVEYLPAYVKFDWAPMMIIWFAQVSGSSIIPAAKRQYLTDIDIPCILKSTTTQQMHYVALYSELALDMVDKVIRR